MRAQIAAALCDGAPAPLEPPELEALLAGASANDAMVAYCGAQLGCLQVSVPTD